jgi:hypothetical protein
LKIDGAYSIFLRIVVDFGQSRGKEKIGLPSENVFEKNRCKNALIFVYIYAILR